MKRKINTMLVVSTLIALAGFFHLSNATFGVGLICGACYLGIIARIVQADGERKR